ncbi:hypothetical protein GF312_21965 [Candidatus Poribacteria bacterium]|nr:hypothetical protein [Candidatus Poribacteria bacterium]
MQKFISKIPIQIWLFIVILSIYLLFSSGHISAIDNFMKYMITESLVMDGDARIENNWHTIDAKRFDDSKPRYSPFPIGQSLFAVPWFIKQFSWNEIRKCV